LSLWTRPNRLRQRREVGRGFGRGPGRIRRRTRGTVPAEGSARRLAGAPVPRRSSEPSCLRGPPRTLTLLTRSWWPFGATSTPAPEAPVIRASVASLLGQRGERRSTCLRIRPSCAGDWTKDSRRCPVRSGRPDTFRTATDGTRIRSSVLLRGS